MISADNNTPPIDESSIEHRAACLRAAENAYREAAGIAAIARNKETDALNALNAAQAAFDKAAESMRRSAPRSSDWNRPLSFPA
jgi:hypothetical protein